MPQTAQRDSESLLKHGVIMICAGTAVCALGSLMARPAHQQTGYIVVALLIAGCLLIALLSPRFRDKRALSRSMTVAYTAVSSAIVCYMAISALRSSSGEIPAVGILTCLLGLFWSARFMTLAFGFQPRTPQAAGLCALAAANSSFSFILGTRTELGKLWIVALCGCYVIVLGIQIYLTAVMLHREAMRAKVFDRP
jgi:uncharacterized membrane protein YfcA